MSTIPLTPVEGIIALPRSRPFDVLPASFGREWALLPPNVSFRVELKALYAAMLRTFCLSADAIRSMCRWEPRRQEPEAIAAPSIVQACAAEPDLSQGLSVQPGSVRIRSFAGGACMIGGAAALGWLALAHSPVQKQNGDVALDVRSTHAGNVRPEVAARPAPVRPAPVRPAVASDKASAAMVSRNASAAAAAGVKAGASSANRKRVDAARQPATAVRKSARYAARNAVIHAQARNVRAPSRGDMESSRRYTAGKSAHVPQTATTHRTEAAPSIAGRFSSHPAAPIASDDYASIMTWARTHTGDRVPPRHDARTSDANWMAHMTQRRVTEVPERFSK